jgi:KDO2-lipid IV(A) lauroyltransferase
VLEAMPQGVRYGLGRAGGALWFRASRAQARNAFENYAAVLERSPDDPGVGRIARRAFENYGRMLVDFVLIGSVQPDQLLERVGVRGRENLDAALAAGNGCILAVPHMGAWDMGGAVAGVLGYRIFAVAERFPGSLDDAVVETRERFGVRIIPLGRSAVRGVQDALVSNGVVCLLCDLEQGPGGAEVEFFGRRALVPAGPAAFSLKTGAALLPSYVYRAEAGHYQVHLDPALDYRPTGDRKADIRALMQMVVRRFEDFIRERPDQWYAFRPMFRN